MLELTNAASEQLHKSLVATRSTEQEGKCFRIVPQDERRLTLELGKPAPSDATYEHEGDVVLAVPKALASYVKDRSLDIDSNGNLKLRLC